jgi:hypothetical protein
MKNENAKIGLLNKVLQGKYVTSAPIGYYNTIINGKSHLVHDARAPMIKEVFERYAYEKISINALSKVMEKKYGFPLARSTLYKALRNPFYYGKMLYKGRLYDHCYEPIMSEELFNDVQKKIDEQSCNSGTKKGFLLPFLYRKLITCGQCGTVLSGDLKKGHYTYYRCSTKHGYPAIKEEAITAAIAPLFALYGIKEDIFEDPHRMKLCFNMFIECCFVNSEGQLEIKIKTHISPSSHAYIADYINNKNMIVLQKSPEALHAVKEVIADPILQYCMNPHSIDEIAAHFNIEITKTQTKILDLYLENSLQETDEGLWKTV